ncbi:MAG: response regulator transcription factor [Inconstantimicrobium porci]|uniref:response regulator transcription factor n=1 Tax=Inconstantimicrobium porci TaxID=2652291 RepID=UPI002409F634|nr:response regulator transcription factor [Inconstantimicrobium porci]MDD6769405.1 response regulator transcription factor [Inconstantimicrobium porci]MDY5913288.1 response regulator transcription factor [Inconstantimicrobium porci]
MKKILIIEDDALLKKYMKEYLNAYDYDISTVEDFDNIEKIVMNEVYDLILLDINLPKFDGFYFLKLIRKKLNVPVIIVSARSEEGEQIRGMDLGADDYITKPFSMGILLAKINAVLRRTEKSTGIISEVNDIKLVYSNMELNDGDRVISLTKNEFNILKIFFENYRRVITREQLLNELWDEDEFVDDNTLTVNITRVKKLIKNNNLNLNIETKRGIGYVLC